MKKISMIVVCMFASVLRAVDNPYITQFNNGTPITINMIVSFTNNTKLYKTIAANDSLKMANFITRTLTSVVISSPDKDSNGNAYQAYSLSLPTPTQDVQCDITLQDVPAHKVKESDVGGFVIPAYEVPATQKIIAKLSPLSS